MEIAHLVMDLDGKRELRVAAFDGHELMATASVACWGRAAVTIYQLFVTKDHRRKGVGRAMVDHVLQEAYGYCAEAVSAIVEDGGPIDFWKAMGFKVAHSEDAKVLVSRRLV